MWEAGSAVTPPLPPQCLQMKRVKPCLSKKIQRTRVEQVGVGQKPQLDCPQSGLQVILLGPYLFKKKNFKFIANMVHKIPHFQHCLWPWNGSFSSPASRG